MVSRGQAVAIGAVAAIVAAGGAYLHRGERHLEASAKAAAAAPGPRPATRYGVVLTTPETWSQERSFGNLAMTGRWMVADASGWRDMAAPQLGPTGPRWIGADEKGVLTLAPPGRSHVADVAIRCTFAGKATVEAFNASDRTASANRVDFTWQKGNPVSLLVLSMDRADPVRAIDCREKGAGRTLFDPGFLSSQRGYAAVRFLDWQRANDNRAVTWATRTLPDAIPQNGPDGIAVEHMVALANELGADPWFCMPYNADDDYVRRFADYVHRHLDPRLTAYVEAGNETWNFNFAVAQQVLREARARRMASDDNVGRMQVYAQRSVAMFEIFSRAFADTPKRLVRVIATQAAWPQLAEHALAYKDTARHVDALAIAPYFGGELLTDPATATGDLDQLFGRLDVAIDQSMETVRQNRALADRYKLRLVAYEAGQHVTYSGQDKELIGRLNRDPRMRRAYERYLAGWTREAGDLAMMFASVSPIGAGAAWGLQEYSGQPAADAPKLQAVLAARERAQRR